MFQVGIVLLWVFLAGDVALIHKTGASQLTAIAFIIIRTIPLIMVTAGGMG